MLLGVGRLGGYFDGEFQEFGIGGGSGTGGEGRSAGAGRGGDKERERWEGLGLMRRYRCETAAGRKVNIEITAIERRLEEVREREMEVRKMAERI